MMGAAEHHSNMVILKEDVPFVMYHITELALRMKTRMLMPVLDILEPRRLIQLDARHQLLLEFLKRLCHGTSPIKSSSLCL
jgi:predicted polyphosphate/ATP-dependent NAD kinase